MIRHRRPTPSLPPVVLAAAAVLAAMPAALSGCAGPLPEQGTTPTGPTEGAAPGDPAAAATPSAPAAAPAGPPQQVTSVEGIREYRLDNGMRVLLFPDASQATVTVNVTYFVGSRHEGYGEAGMAHLLEHMVFKGTPTHADIWKLLEDHGARFNGTTWVDRTNYFETLPASDENLSFAIALEADRMVNSSIAAEALAKEFSVVRNEFEAGENDPRSVLEERMYSSAYLWHNYGKSTIGNKSDIERVPADSLRRFYQRYYQPDNAMVVVAGRFDEDRALALIQEHFGAIPRPARELPATYTVEPVQDGEREVILRRAGDVGVVGVLYHGVPGAHEDFVAMEALVHVLTDEPSGRLYQALVESGLASSVSGAAYSWADPGVVQFFAEVPSGKPLEPVRDKMIEVIEGLGRARATQAISAAEVTRFQNRERKQLELAMTQSQRIAIWLSEYAAMGDWRLLFVYRDRVDSLDLARVQRVAGAYFKRSNRTVGMFIPTAEPARAPAPERPDVAALTDGYQGRGEMAKGEAFDPTVDNVEARTRRYALDNGMKVALLAKETRGDAVEATITIHYGSERDLKGKTTAADMIPEMLLRGSKRRSYQEVRDELDRLKAQVRFGGGFGVAGSGTATARITTTRDNLPEVLALVAELWQEPAFAPSEFEIVRKEWIARLEESMQDPAQQAFTSLWRRLYDFPAGDVRYVPTTAEELAQVRRVKIGDLRALHSRLWGAGSAEITIVGDFDPAAVEPVLARRFGGWKAARDFTRIPVPYRKTKPGADVLSFADKKNAFVGATQAIEIRDDDPAYPALEMIGYILAGSGSSRVMDRLRQKEGLSYGAFGGVFVDSTDRRGMLFTAAICAPQNAEKALALMMEEIEKLVAEGVSAEELADAQKSYLARFESSMARDGFLAGTINDGLYLGRTLAFQAELNQRIAALTPADIAAALKKFVHPAEMYRVRAGDFGGAGQ